MIEVLVVDDHAIFRRGIAAILAEAGDMAVGAEAGSVEEALERLRDRRCDVALVDIAMPGRNGIDLLEYLRARHPGLPVLIMSVYPEDQYALRLLKMGASGYLNKESAPTQLIDAIRRVASGRRFVSPALAELLAEEQLAGSGKAPHETLSNREYQVFLRIAAGAAVSEIAESMCLSVKTVSTYRSRVIEKLRVQTNADLTIYAVKHGLIV